MAKKWPFAIAWAAGAAWLFMLAPAKINQEKRKKFSVRFFAHRGLHTGDGRVPENSLAAFRRAAEEGFGAELDVTLDANGNVVVFHDEELERMTGIKGRISDTTAQQLSKLRLLGSDQKIPLLSEVLEACAGIPLIVELKSTPRYRELCRKTLNIISKYPGKVVIESFDPRIVAWFRVNASCIVRGQLYTRHTKKNIKSPLKRFAMNNMLTNFISKPQFIACDYRIKSTLPVKICRLFGAASIVWTTKTRDETIYAINSDGIIFEQHNPHML